MAEFPTISNVKDINNTTLAQLEKCLQEGGECKTFYLFGNGPMVDTYIVGEMAMQHFRVWAERVGQR